MNSPPYWPQANGEVENINKSLKKRLQISYLNNERDYQRQIMDYITMYNVTPHGTTGKSPSELLFNRRIKDKIPCLEDINIETLDEEVYDQDLVQKDKGKRREDSKRRANEKEIKPGDKVVVKNIFFPHKLTANFSNIEYNVLHRNGNELTLFGDGKTIKRNVAHVKRIPDTSPTVDLPEAPPDPSTSSSTLPSTQPTSEDTTTSEPPPAGGQHEEEDSNAPRVTSLVLVKKGGMWQPADARK